MNLFSHVTKRMLILHESTHYIVPYEKEYFFLNVFFFYRNTWVFSFTLEVEGFFLFAMISYLHKKFQRK